MTKRKPIKTEEELVEAFDQLFDEIPSPQTREEIDEYIYEAGIDPEEFGAEVANIAADALKESPLNWRNRGQEEIARARANLEKIEKVEGRDRSNLLSIIDKFMEKIRSTNPKLAPIHYRSRDELSDEDLVSLVQELTFIAEQSNIDPEISE
jgi:hypothetical protein